MLTALHIVIDCKGLCFLKPLFAQHDRSDEVYNEQRISEKNICNFEFNLRSSQSGAVLNKSEFVALLLKDSGVQENTLKFQEVYNLKIDEVIEDVRKEAE